MLTPAQIDTLLKKSRGDTAIIAGSEVRQLCAMARQVLPLRMALRTLVELGEHVPVFQLDSGKSSVKAVRLAGEFLGAMEQARAVLSLANGIR